MARSGERAVHGSSFRTERGAAGMFGLSLGKLLVLAIVIGVVWFGWKRIAALGQALQRAASQGAGPRETGGGSGGKASLDDKTIDLVKDPVTGDYKPTKRD